MNSKKLRRPKPVVNATSHHMQDEFRQEVEAALESLSEKDRETLTAQFLGTDAKDVENSADPEELLDGRTLSETRGDTAQALRHLIRYSQRLKKKASREGEE